MRIRIRIDSEYAGDPKTQTYTDSTFAEAVAALQGTHDEFHKDRSVYIINTHAEDHTVEGTPGRTRTVSYRQGEPVFGERVTVYGRGMHYGTVFSDTKVSFASFTGSTEETHLALSLITLALQLAEAANAEPVCAKCAERIAEDRARWAK